MEDSESIKLQLRWCRIFLWSYDWSESAVDYTHSHILDMVKIFSFFSIFHTHEKNFSMWILVTVWQFLKLCIITPLHNQSSNIFVVPVILFSPWNKTLLKVLSTLFHIHELLTGKHGMILRPMLFLPTHFHVLLQDCSPDEHLKPFFLNSVICFKLLLFIITYFFFILNNESINRHSSIYRCILWIQYMRFGQR